MTATKLTVTALSGAAVGAVITAMVTAVTGWLTRRHEDRRWLRDKRLETYHAVTEAAEPLLGSLGQPSGTTKEQTDALLRQLKILRLIAPQEVRNLADLRIGDMETGHAPGGENGEQFIVDLQDFVDALRADLVPAHMDKLSRRARKQLASAAG